MIQISVPGYKELALKYLVLDYNGTIAHDGKILPQVVPRLNWLREQIEIIVVTADTYSSAAEAIGGRARLKILETSDHRAEKAKLVESLGPDSVFAIGNGRNDSEMLKLAAVGVAVLQGEGVSCEALNSADIVVKDITDALELLSSPKRLIATLRS